MSSIKSLAHVHFVCTRVIILPFFFLNDPLTTPEVSWVHTGKKGTGCIVFRSKGQESALWGQLRGHQAPGSPRLHACSRAYMNKSKLFSFSFLIWVTNRSLFLPFEIDFRDTFIVFWKRVKCTLFLLYFYTHLFMHVCLYLTCFQKLHLKWIKQ